MSPKPPDTPAAGELVPVGRISGVFGVRGWIRVHSYTSPRGNVIQYSPWHLRQGEASGSMYRVLEGRANGDGVVAALDGISDRDAAGALVGAEIAVARSAFAEPKDCEFFWIDLQGMEVRTATGQVLGVVDHLFETGANDVLVVRGDRRRLIPFVYGATVLAVDQVDRVISVAWDPDF